MSISYEQVKQLRDVLNKIEFNVWQVQALNEVSSRTSDKKLQIEILSDVSDLVEEQNNLKVQLIDLLTDM